MEYARSLSNVAPTAMPLGVTAAGGGTRLTKPPSWSVLSCTGTPRPPAVAARCSPLESSATCCGLFMLLVLVK